MNSYNIIEIEILKINTCLIGKFRWLRNISTGYFIGAFVFVWITMVPNVGIAQQVDDYGNKLGTVHFPVSCKAPAQNLMERGVALMHHMTYSGARKVFEAARAADPDCALAYWGVAMTYIHPLWPDQPTREQIRLGQNLVKTAKTRGKKTAREHAYIAALDAYYGRALEQDHRTRLGNFEKVWGRIYEEFPDDLEAASFYALAHMAMASKTDKSYQKQKEAGAIAEKVLARIPGHPGAHHYIIHAYDSPELASRALDVARNYGKVAPDVPHALHMPTHIFTRLGLWQESIEWNRRSAAAAWRNKVNGEITMHYPHALDYLAYAYLQQGRDEKAKEILNRILSLSDPFYDLNAESAAYAIAAIQARYSLERQQWEAAARLAVRQPSSFPWGDRYAAYEAITHFSRALGAARSGYPSAVKHSIAELERLHDIAVTKSAYWANQVEIQRISAQAWLAFAQKREGEALRLMKHAADIETSTDKSPTTPGEVLPSRELLGDMLLELDRPGEALQAYEAELVRSPNRFNTLYGAGRAAELAQDRVKAKAYYRNLLDLARHADGRQMRLQHARRYLDTGNGNGTN
jgi:tetratricopeptide (TPR) repeat protein